MKGKKIILGLLWEKRIWPSLHSCDCHLHFLRTVVKTENGFTARMTKSNEINFA